MVDVIYRPAALADLDGIYDVIEQDDPRRAAHFVNDIRSRCRNLSKYPMLGPAREDLAAGIRIYPMPRRVVVAYRITPSAVEITRVFWGGQDYETLIRDDEFGA
jgi:toxin ParE1/3/4